MSARRKRQRERRRQPDTSPASGQDRPGLWSDASLADLRLLRRAIREGWPVPEERRPGIIAEVSPLIGAEQARVAIAAAWVFLEADHANLREAARAQRCARPGAATGG
jgi:hypothetical protein